MGYSTLTIYHLFKFVFLTIQTLCHYAIVMHFVGIGKIVVGLQTRVHCILAP